MRTLLRWGHRGVGDGHTVVEETRGGGARAMCHLRHAARGRRELESTRRRSAMDVDVYAHLRARRPNIETASVAIGIRALCASKIFARRWPNRDEGVGRGRRRRATARASRLGWLYASTAQRGVRARNEDLSRPVNADVA